MRPTPWTCRIATVVATAALAAVPAVAQAARPAESRGLQSPATFNRTTSPVDDVATQLGVVPRRGLFTPMNVRDRWSLRAAPPPAVAPVALATPGTAAAARASGQLASAAQPGSGALAYAPGPSGAAAGEAATRALPPVARGGGPRGVPTGTVLRTWDQRQTFPVALPLGCTRISAVGTPAVRDVALEVHAPNGLVTRTDARRGRLESATVCGRDRGQYDVTVRLRGARSGVVASQLFVDREPESGSAVQNRVVLP